MAENKKLFFLNKTKNKMLAAEANHASSFVARLIGLLRTPELTDGQGLYIVPCSQIHMFGMKYAIDVLFMDKTGLVVGVCNSIQPGQISALFQNAHACLELPKGILLNTATAEGDQIEFGEAPYKN